MAIFLLHAKPDLAVAEALETVLERRCGQFVELDDGETALRPLGALDAVVLLISKDLIFSPWRLRLEQRALDAWAEGKLVLVKLDKNFAPVGLRDLPFIDASFEAQRDFTWGDVATQVKQKLTIAPPPAASAPAPGGALGGRPQAPSRKRSAEDGLEIRDKLERESRARRRRWWLAPLLMLPGIGALIASGAIFLVNRIGPTPGTFADLIAGIDAFGVRYGLPSGATPIVFAAAIGLMIAAPVLSLISGMLRKQRHEELSKEYPELSEDYEGPSAPTRINNPVQSMDAAAPADEAVFVSYSRKNEAIVLPVCAEVTKTGKKLWLDQQSGLSAGDSWAGEIVRAIKHAEGVMVMCSSAAFESDHVKREVYLADRYKKKLLPIFIEDAQPPEDFEYFFAGVQFLKLHETPEADRGAAVLKVLGTA
jgi:hypothetical protein